jgi:P27 family predicted phage terminase small subunit
MNAPEHLDEQARAKWAEVLPILDGRGDTLDAGALDALTCYCSAWSRLVDSESKIKESGTVVRTAAGFAAVSPYVTVQKDAARQLRQWGDVLQLTSKARGRKPAKPESAVARILRTIDGNDTRPRRRKATA